MRLAPVAGLAIAASLAVTFAVTPLASALPDSGGSVSASSGAFQDVDTWPPGQAEHSARVDEAGQRIWARPDEVAFISFGHAIPARTSTRVQLDDGRTVGQLLVGSGGVYKISTPATGTYSGDLFVSYLDENGRRVSLRSGRLVSKNPARQLPISSPYDPLDVMMVVDTSGSMKENDPDGRRGDALNIIYRLSRIGDRIGTVGFSTNSRIVQPFTQITSGDQAQRLGLTASQAIGNSASGWTNYDDAFERAASEINKAGLPSRRKVVVFLSDGGHNRPTEQYQNTHQTFTHNSTGRSWPICAIQLGTDLSSRDVNRLKRIASSTGGEYVKTATAAGLVDAFNRCRGIAACEYTVEKDSNAMVRNETRRIPANVPLSRRLATFRVSGDAVRHSVDLIAPSGNTYGPGNLIAGITYKTGRNWATYEVQNPRAGGWAVQVRATGVAAGESDVVTTRATVDRCGTTTRLVNPD